MKKKSLAVGSIALFLAVLAAGASRAYAQKGFEVVTGKAFEKALPKDFYLEGDAIPTEARNAALLITPSGHRLVVALIDTAGYSSQVQEKYIGMLINEGPVTVCGKALGVGSFGFGLKMSSPDAGSDANFFLYDQAGKEVSQCAAKKDNNLQRPTPLQIVLEGQNTAHLYLGRHMVAFKP